MITLLLIVFLAFVVETVVGFGSTVLTVALASQFYPIDTILPLFVPVNLLQSLYIVLRHGKRANRPLLFQHILPWMGAGVPVGLMLFESLQGPGLKMGFAIFLIALSLFELLRTGSAEPLSKVKAKLVLVSAGIVHGLYATGGPMLVYFAGRELTDKGQFRSTLSAVWLCLNIILVASYGYHGRLQLVGSLTLLPPLLGGIVAGEWIHDRVDGKTFRSLVFAVLLVSGILLALK